MSKNNQNSFQPVNSDYDGPTLQEVEFLLNRIEELDAPHYIASIGVRLLSASMLGQ